ncbi:MAG TPA: hypothetical protein VMV86_00260 [Methanosarcinales archaeon]|nr:hypothetical protein [Methanosarcinales archaeon]
MKISYLKYIGNKEKGKLTVKIVSPLSLFRDLKYFKGMALKVGSEIPEGVAEFIAGDYKDLFVIENDNVDPEVIFRSEFLKLLDAFKDKIKKDKIEKLVSIIFREDRLAEKSPKAKENKMKRRKAKEENNAL